jgi:tetratricopeptide (TPR) repeat protein
MRSAWLKLLAATALLTPAASFAYDFQPTPLEFASWPAYCRARYVETSIGRLSQYANQVSPAERRVAEESIGANTYLHVHHHCAGVAWLARSKTELNPQQRRFMLGRAKAESGYTLRNTTSASPLYSNVLTNLARVAQAEGNVPGAEGFFDQALQAKPGDAQTYVAMAILYRDTKRLPKAREILEKGLTATEGKAVEIHYTLGLICFDLKDSSCAVEHARVAYDAGYPLPGLKDKLAKGGLWTE